MVSTFKRFIAILFILILFLSLPGMEIHEAVKKGDLKLVSELLKKSPELVNVKDKRGNIPLHLAAKTVNIKVLEMLIRRGSKLNISNNSGYTPLHYAAYYNRGENVEKLLKHGVGINLKSLEGETPLHMTAYSGSFSTASILIKHAASITAREARGRTPLILTARESGDMDMVRLLIAEGSDINAVDNSGHSALSLAAWRGYRSIVDLLLDNQAGIPQREIIKKQLLEYSLKNRLDRLFRRLIVESFDLKELSRVNPELINEAVAGGSSKIVRELMTSGFKADFRDRIGWTPLHYAAEYDRASVFEFLIRSGANINIRTSIGETPYNIAERRANHSLIELFKKYKAETVPPRYPELSGKHLGQPLPANEAIPFAPAIVGGFINFTRPSYFPRMEVKHTGV